MSNDFSVSPCTEFVNLQFVNVAAGCNPLPSFVPIYNVNECNPCPTCGHINLVMNANNNCYQGLFNALTTSFVQETFQPVKPCPDCPPMNLTMNTFVIHEGYWHVKGCPRTEEVK